MTEKETSPIDVLRYDTVVRLTLYRANSDPPDRNDQFAAAWKSAFSGTAIPGVLYRELCRQRPEWNALAAKEIEHAIDAAFIEAHAAFEAHPPRGRIVLVTKHWERRA